MPTEHERLVAAFREALRDDGPDIPLLVKRIPGICADIRDLRADMRWIKWLLMGIAAGIGLLALKALGA